MSGERPIVHCLAAFVERDADRNPIRLRTPFLINLFDAPFFVERGYWIVGPDLDDMASLARWERQHASPHQVP